MKKENLVNKELVGQIKEETVIDMQFKSCEKILDSAIHSNDTIYKYNSKRIFLNLFEHLEMNIDGFQVTGIMKDSIIKSTLRCDGFDIITLKFKDTTYQEDILIHNKTDKLEVGKKNTITQYVDINNKTIPYIVYEFNNLEMSKYTTKKIYNNLHEQKLLYDYLFCNIDSIKPTLMKSTSYNEEGIDSISHHYEGNYHNTLNGVDMRKDNIKLTAYENNGICFEISRYIKNDNGREETEKTYQMSSSQLMDLCYNIYNRVAVNNDSIGDEPEVNLDYSSVTSFKKYNAKLSFLGLNFEDLFNHYCDQTQEPLTRPYDVFVNIIDSMIESMKNKEYIQLVSDDISLFIAHKIVYVGYTDNINNILTEQFTPGSGEVQLIDDIVFTDINMVNAKYRNVIVHYVLKALLTIANASENSIILDL